MRSNKGFTIIEMLVIIGVMALLSGVLILYSRSGETASSLIRQAAQITADINRTKSLAITTARFTDSTGQEIRSCGYGVYFDASSRPNRYIIFADLSSNCETSLHQRNQSGEADVAEIPVLSSFSLNPNNIQQVFFLPPDPMVFFTTLDGKSASKAQIAIRAANDAQIGIEINSAGQISSF